MKERFKIFYRLAKPGIVYGNAITAVGGFLLASQGTVDVARFVSMAIGISLVMASACVFNNYIDRDIDLKMNRTKKRALVTGIVTPKQALVYATTLLAIGLLLLAMFTNILAAGVALFGHFAYVIVYGIGKRKTVHGTVIGSISGAVPPVVGYVAATGGFDVVALLLFIIVAVWQMPHFYAIALYRQKEYAAASIPVLPLIKGEKATKIQMIFYIVVFMITTALLSVYGATGYTYLVIMLLVSSVWLYYAIKGLSVTDTVAWAKHIFRFSLIVILVFSLMISLDDLLP